MADEIRIPITSDSDLVPARAEGRALALELGFSRTDATLIATAISEVARNIVQYAGDGEVSLSPIRLNGREGIKVVAEDHGPGIESVEQALRGEHADGRVSLGLPGARRLMDEFRVVSEAGKGTTVTMIKWKSRPDSQT